MLRRHAIAKRHAIAFVEAENALQNAVTGRGPAMAPAHSSLLLHGLISSIADLEGGAIAVAGALANRFQRADLAADVLVVYIR